MSILPLRVLANKTAFGPQGTQGQMGHSEVSWLVLVCLSTWNSSDYSFLLGKIFAFRNPLKCKYVILEAKNNHLIPLTYFFSTLSSKDLELCEFGFGKSIWGKALIVKRLPPSVEYHRRISTKVLCTSTGNKKRQLKKGIKWHQCQQKLRFYLLHNGSLSVTSLFHNSEPSYRVQKPQGEAVPTPFTNNWLKWFTGDKQLKIKKRSVSLDWSSSWEFYLAFEYFPVNLLYVEILIDSRKPTVWPFLTPFSLNLSVK